MNRKIIGITVGTTMNPEKIAEKFGSTGVEEVYIGDDPPDTAKMWIDTDEETTVLATLQAIQNDVTRVISSLQMDNGVLPNGYTPLPSIKFTGEQAVDTGIICNQNTRIRVVFTIDEEKVMYIYGVANADHTASLTGYRSSSGGRWRFGNQFIALTTPVNESMVWGVQVDKAGILRSNVYSNYGTVSDFTTDGTLVLGGGRLADGNVEEGTRLIGKIIAFDLYDGDELVQSFVPCKNADGVCGFWDNISKQFFTSATNTPLEWSFT